MVKDLKSKVKYRFLRQIPLILIIFLLGSIIQHTSYIVQADTVVCHRCGMVWEKDRAIIVSVNNQNWYECCPICALMDIIQHGDNDTEHQFIAKCETTNETITLRIFNGNVLSSEPSNPVILFGKTCETNKIFKDNITAETYKTENSLDSPIYSIQEAIKLIVIPKVEKKEFCLSCGSEIQDNWRVIFTLDNGSSYKYCCHHCANNMYESLKENIESIAVADYENGELLDANNVFFIKDSNVTTGNTQDSRIAFESMIKAYEFRGLYGGSVVNGWDGNLVFCLNCGMVIQPKLATIFLLEDGTENAYCPGCPDAALERLGNQVFAVYVGDYGTGRLVNGYNAYYVNNYNIDIPGTMGGHRIAFSSFENSRKFVDECGGIVVDWNGNVVYGQNLPLTILVIIIAAVIIVFAARSLLVIHFKHKQIFEERVSKSKKIDQKQKKRRENYEQKGKKKKN